MPSAHDLHTAIRGAIRAHVTADERGALRIPTPDTEQAVILAIHQARPLPQMTCPTCMGDCGWDEAHASGDPQETRWISCPVCITDAAGRPTGMVEVTASLLRNLEERHAAAMSALQRVHDMQSVPLTAEVRQEVSDAIERDRFSHGVPFE